MEICNSCVRIKLELSVVYIKKKKRGGWEKFYFLFGEVVKENLCSLEELEKKSYLRKKLKF